MIVAMAGLPGTGKSTLSRALAGHCGGLVLDKDEIRAALFPQHFMEYSNQQDDFCQRLMLEAAAYLLGRHNALRVFLDGRTFSRRYQLEGVIEAARAIDTGFRVIECVCSEQTARRRLEGARASHPARNRSYELYQSLQAQFEPIAEPKLVIDTDAPLEECIARARAYVE